MRLSEQFGIVPLIEADDYGSAGIDSDSIKLSTAHWVTALLTFGEITGNSVLKVFSGATAGAKTTALTFTYRVSGADFKTDGADQYGTAATSAALTLTAASYDHRAVLVEVDPQAVTDGEPWITVEIDATATALNVGGFALVRPRYAPALTAIA